MNFDHVLPVLTLVLGRCLNSWNPFFQERRDYRRALSRALTELLEIRHELLGKQTAMKVVHGKLPPAEERMMRSLVTKIQPPQDDISKRYNEVVDLISSFDPLLGFQLRSKEIVMKAGPMLSQFENMAGEPIPLLSKMEDLLTNIAVPHLREVILDLAGRRGYGTKRRIKRQLDNNEMPVEVAQILKLIESQASKQQTNGLGQSAS